MVALLGGGPRRLTVECGTTASREDRFGRGWRRRFSRRPYWLTRPACGAPANTFERLRAPRFRSVFHGAPERRRPLGETPHVTVRASAVSHGAGLVRCIGVLPKPRKEPTDE